MDNRAFEGIMTAKEVATFGIRGNLRVQHHICKDVGVTVSTTIVDGINLARERIETKRENAKLFEGNFEHGSQFCGGLCCRKYHARSA